MWRWLGWGKIPSEKNGVIEIMRVFGRPDVFVGGTDMSSPYMRRLWRAAVRRVKGEKTNVLMLGLGTGIGIPEIRRRFRGAKVTVIEWDPVMIDLFKEYRPRDPSTILQGDVRDVLPTLSREFDLVLVDIFQGHDPAPALYEEATIRAIANAMTDDAECVVNAYETPGLFDRVGEFMTLQEKYVFRASNLATFMRSAA